MKKLICAMICILSLAVVSEAAKIILIRGKPEIQKSESGKWQSVKQGSELYSNDKIRCGNGAQAIILLNSGHRIKLWPKSEIVLNSIDSGVTKIDLALGRLRSWVKKLRSKEKFEVKTPISVCSVRGTDFSVELIDNNQSVVEVYEGAVAAREAITGSEVMVNRGEYSVIQQNEPPSQPKEMPEERKLEGEAAGAERNTARKEARNEIFQEISREAVLSRAADEIKLAEYQNGKAVVDVSGNRVRIEEYIVRTQPNEFKYVVLNTRENKFDFGKIVFTFNIDLPENLTLATKTMFHSDSSVKPDWWLTDVLSVMSNTIDQVNEQASGGQMYADNPTSPLAWTLGFNNYQFSVNNKTWWSYSDNNSNGRVDSGEISYFNIASGAKINFSNDFQYDSTAGKYYLLDSAGEKVYFNESSQPSGNDSFHFYQKNNYSLDPEQWIATDDYVIDDNGKILGISDLRGKTSAELEKKAYESNFERVYSSSVFNGRTIGLVFSAKLLIDAGILNLPEPGNIR